VAGAVAAAAGAAAEAAAGMATAGGVDDIKEEVWEKEEGKPLLHQLTFQPKALRPSSLQAEW
jgi:hypothetical protein